MRGESISVHVAERDRHSPTADHFYAPEDASSQSVPALVGMASCSLHSCGFSSARLREAPRTYVAVLWWAQSAGLGSTIVASVDFPRPRFTDILQWRRRGVGTAT